MPWNPLGVLPDQIAIPVSEKRSPLIGAHTETLSSKTGEKYSDAKKQPGAYGVRYLFVICGFSITETGNLRRPFLLGRAPEGDHLEPF